MNKESYELALNKMASYCSVAERCRSEVAKKLEKWKLTSEEVNAIFTFLEKEKFIDEMRYAQAYVNDKYRFSKWGKKKISQYLYLKGIDKNIAAEAIVTVIDEAVYLDNLREILKIKKKSLKANSSYEQNQKLARFALSRGFEYSDVIHIIPQLEDPDIF